MAETPSLRAVAMHQQGRTAEAIASLQSHLRFKPRDASSLATLGVLMVASGRATDAVQVLARAIAILPQDRDLHVNMGHAMLAAGRGEEALDAWRQALRIDPADAELWSELCAHASRLDRSTEAIEAGRRAVDLAPDSAQAATNLGFALLQACREEEAAELLESWLEGHPGHAVAESNLLLVLNYLDRRAETVTSRHRAAGDRFPAPRPHRAVTSGARPIRVGVISPDLRDHSVGFFAGPLLQGVTAPDTLEVFSLAGEDASDAARAALRSMAPMWHDLPRMDDAELGSFLSGRKLDVLIELSGHSAGGRLAALAGKPAPVMITAIGYPNTTGLPAMDWRVVDSITDPPGSEHLCTEKPLRLDPCFLCYTPPMQAPEPVMPPEDAPLTFGSFNNANKISRQTAELWGGLLQAVPEARLLLKARRFADPEVRRTIRQRLAQAGIEPDRLDFQSHLPSREGHLGLYRAVHVALDTVPYNGTTTTCEALWMGVPVITTLGDRHAARVSASLLHAVGHPEWVAKDAADFARIGAALAADRAGLARMRSSLRTRMQASPLCDRAAYGERFHKAVRACWDWACQERIRV
jgi:protein O-GlcNAc transferase